MPKLSASRHSPKTLGLAFFDRGSAGNWLPYLGDSMPHMRWPCRNSSLPHLFLKPAAARVLHFFACWLPFSSSSLKPFDFDLGMS